MVGRKRFAVASLQTHGYAKDPEDAAYKAITAGLNMDMASQTYSRNLGKLVTGGKVKESEIEAMVLPILEAKYDLGLFDHPYVDESKVDATLDRPEGLVLERNLAARSMVLLRNENHTLPLSKQLKIVAVIGPLASPDGSPLVAIVVVYASPLAEGERILETLRRLVRPLRISFDRCGSPRRKRSGR